jgi:hypothetical protein
MLDHRLTLLAAAAALSLGASAPALAGGCCGGGEFYPLNQGPVFSGPGHDLPRQLKDPSPPAYPYVGFVYSGYPYGLQNSGGYPRGMYSPFAGYPYVDPPPGLNAPSYVKYRQILRPARAYRRHR